MIKINFIGQKNSGKSLSCFMIAKLVAKKNQTLILNFDSLTKYRDFFAKNSINKKIEINHKTINVIQISTNFDFINFDETLESLDALIETLSQTYKIILIDNLISLSLQNVSILKKSDFVILPFKIDKKIEEYKDKVLNFFIQNSIKTENFRFLPFLSKNNDLNAQTMLNLRKQLPSLLFKTVIPYYEFKKYGDLIKNTKLINNFHVVLDEIKMKISEIK